jgi:hypothetical protein
MTKEAPGRLPHDFDPCDLRESAEFFKQEGDEVSDDLQALEREILRCLTDGSGVFEGTIPQTLLPELGAEIYDTLLSNYLKWYRSSLIGVNQAADRDCLTFTGFAQIEKPHHLGLGIFYEMQDAGSESLGPATQLHKICLVPGSVKVVVEASLPVRAVIAAMKIEKTVNHMLADPADIVRKTLECRLQTAYDYCDPLGNIGLSVANGVVGVAIYRQT